MNNRVFVVFSLVCVLFVSQLVFVRAESVQSTEAHSENTPSFVEGEVLIKVSSDPTLNKVEQGSVLALSHVLEVEPLLTLPSQDAVWVKMTSTDGRSTAELLAEMRADPAVLFAEPNLVRKLSLVPNDPSYPPFCVGDLCVNQQPYMSLIGMERVWDEVQGMTGQPVVVAVLDSGLQYTHPDLQSNLWVNSLESPGNGIDDDNNGYVDDIYGVDCLNNDGDPRGFDIHGTSMAGIIGATANNLQGIAGLCGLSSQIKVMGIKAGTDNGGLPSDAILRGHDYIRVLVNRGEPIFVVNGSFGLTGATPSVAEQDAIAELYQLGILYVASAGNNGVDVDSPGNHHYPSDYPLPNLLTVSASGSYAIPGEGVPLISNYGDQTVELFAPGENISGLVGNGTGTSSSTAMASGIAALLCSYRSELADPWSLIAHLRASSTQLAVLEGKVIPGGGRVQADSALLNSYELPEKDVLTLSGATWTASTKKLKVRVRGAGVGAALTMLSQFGVTSKVKPDGSVVLKCTVNTKPPTVTVISSLGGISTKTVVRK